MTPPLSSLFFSKQTLLVSNCLPQKPSPRFLTHTHAYTLTHSKGLLPLLYAMLLHDGPPRHFSSPPTLPLHTLSITTATMKALNNFAIVNLQLVQVSLVAPGRDVYNQPLNELKPVWLIPPFMAHGSLLPYIPHSFTARYMAYYLATGMSGGRRSVTGVSSRCQLPSLVCFFPEHLIQTVISQRFSIFNASNVGTSLGSIFSFREVYVTSQGQPTPPCDITGSTHPSLCRYCSHYDSPELLQELILAVGYFCVLNTENQVCISLAFLCKIEMRRKTFPEGERPNCVRLLGRECCDRNLLFQ